MHFLISRLNICSSVSLSFYFKYSSPLIISMVLHLMYSGKSISALHWGCQYGTQHSSHGLDRITKGWGWKTPLDLSGSNPAQAGTPTWVATYSRLPGPCSISIWRFSNSRVKEKDQLSQPADNSLPVLLALFPARMHQDASCPSRFTWPF